MALIECEDCKGKVSDIAIACPHCGRPTPRELKRQLQECEKKMEESRRRRENPGNLPNIHFGY